MCSTETKGGERVVVGIAANDFLRRAEQRDLKTLSRYLRLVSRDLLILKLRLRFHAAREYKQKRCASFKILESMTVSRRFDSTRRLTATDPFLSLPPYSFFPALIFSFVNSSNFSCVGTFFDSSASSMNATTTNPTSTKFATNAAEIAAGVGSPVRLTPCQSVEELDK